MLPRYVRHRIIFPRYEREVAEQGEGELLELSKFVRQGDLALDVGCNLGVYAFELSRLTGRVMAFEPNPRLADLVEAVAIEGVEVVRVALSSSDGEAQLHIPLSGAHVLATLGSGAFADEGARAITVPARRLDSFDLDRTSFIKIDVEGFEEEVIVGAMKTITRDRPILLIEIEEQHNAGGLDRICDLLIPLGYHGSFLRKGQWCPITEFSCGVHQRIDSGIAAGSARPRRSIDYVNNFLFMPNDQATI